MKIEESSDGTLKVVELDPTKLYWFIIPRELDLPRLKWVNGQIIRMPRGQQIQIVENIEGVEVKCNS